MADWNVTYPDIVGGAIDTYHKSVDNYQKAQTNLMAIKEARNILENQKQNFDIQKKMNNLNLESLGLNNQLTRAELEEKKQSINLQNKLQDQYFKGIDAATIMGEAEAKKTAENSLNQGMVAQTVLGEAKNRGWLENLTPEIVNGKISLKKNEITPYQQEYLNLQREKMAGVEPVRERQAKQQEFSATSNMRKEFLGSPEVEDFIKSKTNVDAMDSMLKNAKAGNIKNKIALDQSIITIFNKLTDPTSVVRESEYARTPENSPMVNRIIGAWDKMSKGGAGLTLADREALVQGAKIIMDERGKTFNNTLSEYTNLAGQYGYDPSLITRGVKEYKPYFKIDNTQSNETDSIAQDKYTVGQKINKNGKVYTYVGNDEWEG